MVGAGQSVRIEDAEAFAADIDAGRDTALPVELESDEYRVVLPAPMVDIGNPAPGEPSLMMTHEFTVSSHAF
jgi:hypothetical protein